MPITPPPFMQMPQMQQRPNPGMALLQQVRGMQGGGPGGGAGGDPTQGLIQRIMSGNPGGLIGALMNRSNAAVNPGTAPAAGSPAYVDPGAGGMGVGPAQGGPPVGGGGAFGADKAGMMGMLSKFFPGMGGG